MFPECTCWQCHLREGLAYLARTHREANTVQHLRIALGIAISFLRQRWVYRVKIIYAGDRVIPYGPCLAGCGKQVRGSRFGRRKLYCSPACQSRHWRKTHRERYRSQPSRAKVPGNA